MGTWISIYVNYVMPYCHCYCDFYSRQKGAELSYNCSVLNNKQLSLI